MTFVLGSQKRIKIPFCHCIFSKGNRPCSIEICMFLWQTPPHLRVAWAGSNLNAALASSLLLPFDPPLSTATLSDSVRVCWFNSTRSNFQANSSTTALEETPSIIWEASVISSPRSIAVQCPVHRTRLARLLTENSFNSTSRTGRVEQNTTLQFLKHLSEDDGNQYNPSLAKCTFQDLLSSFPWLFQSFVQSGMVLTPNTGIFRLDDQKKKKNWSCSTENYSPPLLKQNIKVIKGVGKTQQETKPEPINSNRNSCGGQKLKPGGIFISEGEESQTAKPEKWIHQTKSEGKIKKTEANSSKLSNVLNWEIVKLLIF